jgi:SRSO17 transposase
LAGIAERFLTYMEDFTPLFKFYRKNGSEKARQYLCGLMQAGAKKNMERMVEYVPESDHQAIHQFISNSGWQAQAVMDRVAVNADSLIGDSTNTCLLLDESGFAKKGKMSVGVARQWLGNLGKVDNGQVGVFSVLCNQNQATLINTRLFLPEEWSKDQQRCQKAGVPPEKIEHKSKEELALELILDARRLGLRYGWIGADAGYGKGLEFPISVDSLDETFVIDVHKDQPIYTSPIDPQIPEYSGRGRKPTEYKVGQDPIRVDKWISKQPKGKWRKVKIRESTRGYLTYEVLTAQIWLWKKGDSKAHRWHLIVRRNPKTHDDYKYSLSNAPEKTSKKRLAYMQAQRFWIERVFEDGKSQCGMADYQMRSWLGWHHHMALTMMAMLFMLSERIRNKEEYPLLSCADIEGLLARFLPRRNTTVDEVIAEMERRHKQRQAVIDSAYQRRREIHLLL